jgi:hypothetical protein
MGTALLHERYRFCWHYAAFHQNQGGQEAAPVFSHMTDRQYPTVFDLPGQVPNRLKAFAAASVVIDRELNVFDAIRKRFHKRGHQDGDIHMMGRTGP